MGYLLSQTGQPLQSMDTDNEQTDQLLEEVNVDEQDEGFEEDINEDPTLSFLLEDEANCNPPTVQPVHPSSQSAAASSQSAFSQPAAAASSSRSTTSIVQYAPGSPTQVPEELLVCKFHHRNLPRAETNL